MDYRTLRLKADLAEKIIDSEILDSRDFLEWQFKSFKLFEEFVKDNDVQANSKLPAEIQSSLKDLARRFAQALNKETYPDEVREWILQHVARIAGSATVKSLAERTLALSEALEGIKAIDDFGIEKEIKRRGLRKSIRGILDKIKNGKSD